MFEPRWGFTRKVSILGPYIREERVLGRKGEEVGRKDGSFLLVTHFDSPHCYHTIYNPKPRSIIVHLSVLGFLKQGYTLPIQSTIHTYFQKERRSRHQLSSHTSTNNEKIHLLPLCNGQTAVAYEIAERSRFRL